MCFRDQHILCVCVCVSSSVRLCSCLYYGVSLCVGSPFKLLKESTDADYNVGKSIIPKNALI